MLKYTKHSLKKLETLLQETGYSIRYEKGNFQSGYCIVQHRKVAVINKFYDTEARIHVLLDVLKTIEVEEEQLTDSSCRFFQKIKETEQ